MTDHVTQARVQTAWLLDAARAVARLSTADPTPLETGSWIAGLARDLCNPYSSRRGYLEVGCHRGATFYQVLAEALPLDGRRFFLVELEGAYCKEIASNLAAICPEAQSPRDGYAEQWPVRIHRGTFDSAVDDGFLAAAMAEARVVFWDEGLDGAGVKTYLQDFQRIRPLVTVDQVHLFHDADSRGIDTLERWLRQEGFDTLRLPVPRGVLVARLMPPGRLSTG